jgi:hypothetical protein
MDQLRSLDQVAYVRFASVYRDFKDVSQFMHELETMLERGKRGAVGARPPVRDVESVHGEGPPSDVGGEPCDGTTNT